jgi:hypothetical protein
MPQGLARIAGVRSIAIRHKIFGHERSQSVDKKGSVGAGWVNYQTLIHKNGAPGRRPDANRKRGFWDANFMKFVFQNDALGSFRAVATRQRLAWRRKFAIISGFP